MCARSTAPVGVLLVSTLLVMGLLVWTPLVETLNDSTSFEIVNSESQIFVEKFFGKARFVANLLSSHTYDSFDVNNPTPLVLLVPLVSVIFIRFENEKIKFYHIHRFAAICFIVILLSSSTIIPYNISAQYWGYAYSQETNSVEKIGPPVKLSPDDSIINETGVVDVPEPILEEPIVNDTQDEFILNLTASTPIGIIEEPVVNQTEPIVNDTQDEFILNLTARTPIGIIEEPVVNHIESYDESFVLLDDVTFDLTKPVQEQIKKNYTILFNETINLTAEIQSDLYSILPQNKTILLDEQLFLSDEIILPNNGLYNINILENLTITDQYTTDYNETIVLPPINESSSNIPQNLTFSDQISFVLTDGSIPPNATESWDFENKTDDVTLNDDATIVDTEGINGTSLLLDGDLDYAQTNATNATTYINDMSISAWVKPNYTKGSPEFTVVSKGKSFVLSINNILEPQRVAKFAIFDGIKWTALESTSTIPDSSWTHLTARFNQTAIELYVNGTLENSVAHNGVPYVSERGQIELKTLQEITSYQDIVIGASLTPNMKSDAYNMFSGLIDGVALYDYKLGPEDVQRIYQETTPIITPLPEPEPYGIPEPVLEYRILRTDDLPVSVRIDELNTEIDKLTVSAWITPNYTAGSTEFTVLSRESSFSLAINKMVSPEHMAKFSVYDGITWSTITGSTPINGTAFVTAVFNRTDISLYVNGTLDGTSTGPSVLGISSSNVTIGAYENTLRTDAKQSNFFVGTLEDITIYRHAMVDKEVQEQYWEYLKVYQPPDTKKLTVTLLDSVDVIEIVLLFCSRIV